MRTARDAETNDRDSPPTKLGQFPHMRDGGEGMSDHSFYIWGSYGMAALIFVIEITLVRQRRKSTLRALRLQRDAGDEA
jgi:heme exporter protein CcmD